MATVRRSISQRITFHASSPSVFRSRKSPDISSEPNAVPGTVRPIIRSGRGRMRGLAASGTIRISADGDEGLETFMVTRASPRDDLAAMR